MRHPSFIRPVTEEERQLSEAGRRSNEAFVMRRSQLLLASARGERVPSMASALSCDQHTVRTALPACTQKGPDALQAGSRRPHRGRTARAQGDADTFKALLHRSPRDLGKPTGRWT